MWHWDQGRLDYFQFDELRKIARFAVANDLRLTDRDALVSAVDLPFLPADPHYKPWRNYGRTFQLAMIVTTDPSGGARITEVGKLLADDGKITTDDYFHFFAQAMTDPSPALSSWDSTAALRYPLLFVLRFLLARATQGEFTTAIGEVISAYESSGFRGDEDPAEFLGVIGATYSPASVNRQASESIKVLAQISYMTATKSNVTVSLVREDAEELFHDLSPVGGVPKTDAADEIVRIAALFPSAMAEFEWDYSASSVSDVEAAGFSEGGRVQRTHLTIERNKKIRSVFFDANPGGDCDFCGLETWRAYPWVPRILDLHHLLPLSSGARTSTDGTLLQDMVATCPTCHRAVHRYYDKWLMENNRRDFTDAQEARQIYGEAKSEHKATAHAQG